MVRLVPMMADFPSFSEGLSLRLEPDQFNLVFNAVFPFLFGRAFIEASTARFTLSSEAYFPSFSEGLSLRHGGRGWSVRGFELVISLPFRKGFH